MHKVHYIKGSTLGKYFYKEYLNLLIKIKKLAKKTTFIARLNNIKTALRKLGRFCVTEPTPK